MILGELEADSGKVRQGANLQVAYFDQMRNALDMDATLEDFISPGSEWIEIGTQRKHVKSYLDDFLFSPARANSPVRSLSGGERNRLLLARLFARPANVLVLDEPTNDLDIDTLELLEELLQNYAGTVFIVSHDRAFLDNVATSTLVFEGTDAQPGFWREYEGGVQDWLIQSKRASGLQAIKLSGAQSGNEARRAKDQTTSTATPASDNPNATPLGHETAASSNANNKITGSNKPATKTRKLSYKEQRELESLPDRIAALEAEQKQVQADLADPKLYASDAAKVAQLHARDVAIESELMQALERWELLSA
jgi:ATP-binding cassette subfamily F protein uup